MVPAPRTGLSLKLVTRRAQGYDLKKTDANRGKRKVRHGGSALKISILALLAVLGLVACRTPAAKLDSGHFQEISEERLTELMAPYSKDSAPNWYFHGEDAEFYYLSERPIPFGKNVLHTIFPRYVKVPRRPGFICPRFADALQGIPFPSPKELIVYPFYFGCPAPE